MTGFLATTRLSATATAKAVNNDEVFGNSGGQDGEYVPCGTGVGFMSEKGRETLLFLHGFPLGPAMWEPQRAAFADRYRIVVPDLRLAGTREEGERLPRAVTMEEMADAAVSALDGAGVERAVAVGFSMGGYVAFALHARYPDRLRALVLADTRAEADAEEGRANRRRLAEAVMRRGPGAAVEAMLGKLMSPATAQSNPALVREVERMMLSAPPDALASAALGMALRADRTSSLASIRVPALVMVGEDDVITPPAVARSMCEALPSATLATIAGAGHLANMEQPDAFNEALGLWLERQFG